MRRLLPKPLADADTSTLALLAFLLAAAVVRLLLVTGLPLWLIHTATHDDALFLRIATSLAAGDWLGAHDQLTMVKGPGYPAFLAMTGLSWLPLSLAHALLQTAAVAIAAWAVHRLTASRVLAAVTFLALAFNPAGFAPEMQRVIAAQIHWAQTLLVFSLLAVVLYAPPRSRAVVLALSGLAGLIFGWAWITRADSAWMLPGLAVLAAGALLVQRRDRRALGALLRNLGLAAAAAIVTIGAVMASNLAAYGSFAVYDIDEPNVAAALKALQGVEGGTDNPFIPVPAAVRAKVAKVSPSFAPLERALNSRELRQRWRDPGCRLDRRACGDYAGAWFARALRDAAAMSGAYASPEQAARTFARIADEIATACSEGTLDCRRWPARPPPEPAAKSAPAYVPPTVASIGKRIAFLLPPAPGGIPFTRSNFEPETFQRYWSYLNRPFVTTPGKLGTQTAASGWYYDVASARWPAFAVYARNGALVPNTLTRGPSSDLQRHFNDDRPAQNRFTITYRCPDVCAIAVLRFAHPDLRVRPDDAPARAKSDSATLHIDHVRYDWEATADRTWLQELADRVRSILIPLYEFLAPLALLAGLVMLVAACDGAIATRWLNPVLLVAAAAWTMVMARILTLAAENAVSLVSPQLRDYLPATYLALLAALLSFGAAALQARRL